MKSIAKKIVPFALFAATALLASCGQDPYAPGQSEDASDQPTSIPTIDVSVDPSIDDTVSITVPSGNPEETTMIEKAAENFALKFPNVKIKIEYISIGSYETTVRQRSMSGTLSDIVWTNSPEFLFLIKNDIAEPLDAYFNASTEAGEFSINDYKTRFFDMGSLKGTHYVVPRSADTVVCFSNEELISNAGIDMSSIQNGWTWDQFKGVCSEWRA